MPSGVSSLRLRLRGLLRRRQMEQDFHDEVAFHLAMREEQLRDVRRPCDPRSRRAAVRQHHGFAKTCVTPGRSRRA